MINQIINVALARPGTGKTTNACRTISQWVSLGKRVLLVVPTIALADEVFRRLCGFGLAPLKIDSRNGIAAIATLNQSLDPAKLNNLIVCQHASFHQCNSKYLGGWTVVVDELPSPVRPQATKIKKSQFSLLQYLDVDSFGKVIVRPDCRGKVKDELRTFHGGSSDASPTSLLSKSAIEIYDAALNGQDVFVSNENDSNHVVVFFADEAGFFDRFKTCREVHLLTATWTGSLFEWFANAHGFSIGHSILTPGNPPKHKSKVTIYPMLMSDQCSKSVLNSAYKPKNKLEFTGTEKRNIQVIFDFVSGVVGPDRKCLMFVQDWAMLDYPINFIKCPMDSRGLNDWLNVSDVFCMFHGNHVTTATKCLQYLAEKYNKSFESLRAAWKQTYLLDATLQNVYRCSLRDSTTVTDVRLYVQTYEVAEYLAAMYLDDAIIDMTHARTYREREAPGPKPEARKSEAMRWLASGLKPAVVALKTGIPVQKVYNYNKEVKSLRQRQSQNN